MNITHTLLALVTLGLLAPSLGMARGGQRLELPDESRPVTERIAGIRKVSRGRFALAFPTRMGGVTLDAGARTLSESYELNHAFSDGSALSYFGAYGDESATVYLRHARADGGDEYSAEIMSFEDAGEGYQSHSLSFYEGLTEGDLWLSRGRSLWGTSQGGAGEAGSYSEAMVSTFRTVYDVSSWGYASEDFTYQVGDAYRYEGGGDYGVGGLDQRYFGTVELSLAGAPYALCETEGEVLSEPEGALGFATEARDDCRRLGGDGGYWESWVFTSSIYVEGVGWQSIYSQEILCSGPKGEELRYTWQEDPEGPAGYVDAQTGALVSSPDCAWDPATEMSVY